MQNPVKRINFWSSPRNISTALMYAFARHPEISVVDEPLYAAYLHRFPDLNHPGREVIVSSQPIHAKEVINNTLLGGRYGTPFVLFKQMTHHLEGIDWSFTRRMSNVLLIRDPRAIIASYSKVIPRPDLRDVGIVLQLRLKNYLDETEDLAAIVDSRELLLQPESILRQLCSRLGFDFSASMLSWPAGPCPEDGAWAPYWYSSVHRSTGFLPYEEKTFELPPHLEELARQCRPYYENLYKEALRA